MTPYENVLASLETAPRNWLVTGVAGFIGSNLLEKLLSLNQKVVGLDNFSTGRRRNPDEVRRTVEPNQWKNFSFIQGDIRDLETCRNVCAGADYVLHQAALGSVPRSIENPISTNASNVTGFLNMLWAAKEAAVEKFVYAASSSTYGDCPDLPKVEDKIGKPLSPYAVAKYVNELYAGVFAKTYGVAGIGLRYFNVFGKRQDPNGVYAAVIPNGGFDQKRGALPEVPRRNSRHRQPVRPGPKSRLPLTSTGTCKGGEAMEAPLPRTANTQGTQSPVP